MNEASSETTKRQAQTEEEHKSTEISCSNGDCGSQAAAVRVRQYVAPRNEIEAAVAGILAVLLKIERVGLNDNLVLLGGESLLAAQAAWQIRERYGCEVSLRSVLTGTVENIAAEIARSRS
jgi:acyl carrier protein